ncbi:4-oxalocrotonate tautomerase [Pollutimonas subterranea]|uniref:4-oxalocrotonate tautomerase n=1 Tax=Pollutimonas subterranea TaxID=2045210 RepID=A0A2N4U6X1_9BURK|nr:tautomerase family protein [Pollutimonas subterranea]PLC50776.1 4-oxalocrotonate tautomerase [Pollutimonas subterranea]
MPMMKAHIQSGHTREQKAVLIGAYTDAIAKTLGMPLPTIRVMLEELPPGASGVAGVIDAPLTIIEVFMMEGRTELQKADLIDGLTKATAESLGVFGESVRVLLHDMPKINVGIGGKSAKALGR